MRQLNSAGIIVFREKDHKREYLLLHYSAGHWDFAKGQVESGETNLQAAARELHEETGLTAKLIDGFHESISYIFTDEDDNLVRKVVHFYLGHVSHDPVHLSYEHTDYRWLSFDQARAKLTYQNAQHILEHAEEFMKEIGSHKK